MACTVNETNQNIAAQLITNLADLKLDGTVCELLLPKDVNYTKMLLMRRNQPVF